MLNTAGADTLISCWANKAWWSNWRPITAIQLGDDDGNDRTEGMTAGCRATPLRPTPTTRRGTTASRARGCTPPGISSAPTG
jgi:hypothetical protein